MKDLAFVDHHEQNAFLNSFDLVLCDVDGVLWLDLHLIPGSETGIRFLEKIGKSIVFVSNNTLKTFDVYFHQLQAAGMVSTRDQVVTPIQAIIHYLKTMKFDKDIFVIGMPPLETDLTNAGFKIIENKWRDSDRTSLKDLALHSTQENAHVGAVIVDVDVNINWAQLQQAKTFLQNPKVLFITGAGEMVTTVGKNTTLLGPGLFHKLLQEVTGRTSTEMAKPGSYLERFLMEKYAITDPSRVLFIGDSIPIDMKFAARCGFKKLLVLSGNADLSDVQHWTFSDDLKPDYYLQDLQCLHSIIEKTFKIKL